VPGSCYCCCCRCRCQSCSPRCLLARGLTFRLLHFAACLLLPFLPAVEAFEPRMSSWVPVCAMQQGRAYSAAVCANGTLWVVGGMQGDNYNDSFER
jgi:hypothetical protein